MRKAAAVFNQTLQPANTARPPEMQIRAKIPVLILTPAVFTKYFVSKISGSPGFEPGKESCSGNMHWLRRLFSSRLWSFAFFALLLAAILAGAGFYSGIINHRDLARATATVRRMFISGTNLSNIKMERTTLQFQLASLPNQYAILTNAALERDWSVAAVLSQLDPGVRQAWNGYLGRISPLALKADPGSKFFLSLQQAYELDVDKLAGDWSVADKPAALLNLRTNKFAPLFTNSVYLGDRAQFETDAEQIMDDETIALREAYWKALVSAAMALNPRLSDYGGARLALVTRSGEIGRRLEGLNEQLRSLGEFPEPSGEHIAEPAPVRTPEPPSADRKFFKTYVPERRDFLIIEAVTAIAGFFITLPVEHRRRRWWKIGASMALVFAGLLALRVPMSLSLAQRYESAFAGLAYLIPTILLAAIWAPDLSLMAARLFLHLIDPHGPPGKPVASIRPASRTARRGHFQDALRLVKPELARERSHYEALLLKARLHRQLNHKWRTRLTLKKILRDPNLTEGQRRHVGGMFSHLDDPTHGCWKI
ncbi:MAG: hypothetical protein WBN75_21280 [Verrucomicrobiia bacterium]